MYAYMNSTKHFYAQYFGRKTRSLQWQKSAFEPGRKRNFRVWAAFGLVQLITIGSFGLSLGVHFQQKITLCNPFIFCSRQCAPYQCKQCGRATGAGTSNLLQLPNYVTLVCFCTASCSK